MKFTLHGHSTVSIAAPEGRIVVDPGPFSDLSCLDGAAAIMLTHAHGDHLDADAVTSSGLPVWGTPEVVDTLGTGTVIAAGQTVTVLGLDIQVVGGLHEEIHPTIPRPENLGFYAGGLLHPGDQYIPADAVDGDVHTLLLAISGPWVKGAEAADYARSVGATRTIPVHDALLSDTGKKVLDGFMGKVGVPGYQRVVPGEELTI